MTADTTAPTAALRITPDGLLRELKEAGDKIARGLETGRWFVRKLLAEGLDVYTVDRGHPGRAQRWLTMDDCIDVIRERHGLPAINLLGVCRGGVFAICHATLFPEKRKNRVLTLTPIDFHGGEAKLLSFLRMARWISDQPSTPRRKVVEGARMSAPGRPGRSRPHPAEPHENAQGAPVKRAA